MSITSANAVLMMGISALFPVPQQIQGFSTDDVFDTEALEAAETAMGVDGTLTGGFVYVPVVQGYSLMADSPSTSFFDTWYGAQQTIKDLYFANGTITLPGLQKKYTLTKGILRTYPSIADAGKTLRARKFTIVWQSITPANTPNVT